MWDAVPLSIEVMLGLVRGCCWAVQVRVPGCMPATMVDALLGECCEYTIIFPFSFIIYSLYYFSDIFLTLII